MIEPWATSWSRPIYRHCHPEPFLPDAPTWDFPSSGPLSGANVALPWIVFARDRDCFEAEHPEWRIASIEPCMPFSYLLSGGLSPVSIAPGWAFDPWQRVESLLAPWMRHLAMFAVIVLERLAAPDGGLHGRHGDGTVRRVSQAGHGC
jgi:hypothetical protein